MLRCRPWSGADRRPGGAPCSAPEGFRTSGTRSRAGRRRHLPRTPSWGMGCHPLPRIREVEENDAMGRHDHPAPTAWVGIDVSKDTFDACLVPADGKPRHQAFANDPPGHAALLAWAAGHAAGATLGFCLE